MEGEFANFIKVWLLAICCALYAYTLSRTKHIPKGFTRLLFLLPVVFVFSTLPFTLHSINLGFTTLFYLTWIGNFKIVLLAFDLGPLSTSPPNEPLSPLHFVAIAIFPIRIRTLGSDPNQQAEPTSSDEGVSSILMSRITKVFMCLIVIILLYHKRIFPEWFVYTLYFLHVYLGIEIVFAISGDLVRVLLGLELEPQFREPYLSTSIQEFWGSRWNLISSNVLRVGVFDPVRRAISPALGKKGGALVALISCFTVSGLMHELMFYQQSRASPTWEVTCFFILQGVFIAVEAILKHGVFREWQPNPVVARIITLSIVGCSGRFFFMPQVLNYNMHVKLMDEYLTAFNFLKETTLSLFRF